MSFSSDKITLFSGNKSLKCGNNMLAVDKPLVMGILNLTPDSFFDGGRYSQQEAWILQTEKMISEGASIIDIGAVSSRPGTMGVTEAEEISRLMPVLELLTKRYPKFVFSVDTFRSKIAQLSADAGAGIINDISGGSLDSGLIETVAKTGLPYILMHMQGTPQSMQTNPVYDDIMNEIDAFFTDKLTMLDNAGIEQVVVDPGFGFGKSIEHNYIILNKLGKFKQYRSPLLVGISRKSMIYKLLEIPPDEALAATSAIHMLALLNGADILRVHDVKEAIQVIKLAETFMKTSE